MDHRTARRRRRRLLAACAAIATYGPAELGWAPEDATLLLDHLEGFDPGDVTAQHYNTDTALQRKRRMMRDWIGFLDACEA